MYRMPNALFDPKWYLDKNPDVAKAGVEPLCHYIKHGWKEGRNPSKNFHTSWYLAVNDDVAKAGIEPLAHYFKYGRKEGRKPSLDYGEKALLEKFPTPRKLKKHKICPLSGAEPVPLVGKRLALKENVKLIKNPSLQAIIDLPEGDLKVKVTTYSNKLEIHWVIPDFSPGGGGHMTIFRTIRFLESFGHKNTIWIHPPITHKSEKLAYDTINEHFQQIKCKVKFIDQGALKGAEGDVIFATAWQSVSFVKSALNFKRRFYFVQDHEPEFYPQGTEAILARNTYSEDLDCVCASPWLKQLMEDKYGRWARAFWLSVDFNTYQPPQYRNNSRNIVKIAFYARHFTPRRAVELGLLALEVLAKKKLRFEVHCFGAPLPFVEAPFICFDHGICNPQKLANIYQNCDIGIVFSATNYSLIPQEMMACGLPVAELDAESTRAIFPEGIVNFLPANPTLMAEKLAQMIKDESQRIRQAELAYEWVKQFSWEGAAKSVESAIFERLQDKGFEIKKNEKKSNIKASVIIPTWNAGELLSKVIQRLKTQETPWQYEILVVDSGSTDGTVEYLKQYPDIKLHTISNTDFQHGRTRNLAISLTKGEFIAVLTQDALPVDNNWLHNIVSALENHPEAGGAFGKHHAWPEADPFTKRDMDNHFKQFENHPYCVSKKTDELKWNSRDIRWQQFLHFYSDNNSCMRRSVWEEIPYPEVKFGEDQLWAWKIIKAGYSKVYVPTAAVYHSHNFDEGDITRRAFEEAEFFRDSFGYQMVDPKSAKQTIIDLNKSDTEWGKLNKVSENIIKKRLDANLHKITGFSKAAK
tara:strand:+ start:2 stop:2428 length:2427 start_codon:yes stop_codon:yes gene_type:complete